jgi:galactitol-specific phosphotransferase system IIB component
MADGKDNFPLIQKVITGLLGTALAGSFAWILKIETSLTQLRADVEDVQDDIEDVEKDLTEAKAIAREVQTNRIDLTTVQGIVNSINQKMDDVKRALERLEDR